jgi:hypothetical protein
MRALLFSLGSRLVSRARPFSVVRLVAGTIVPPAQMEDVRCNSFVHCCAARRPGSGVGCPRSSPSPPPACRPRAHSPLVPSDRDDEHFGTIGRSLKLTARSYRRLRLVRQNRVGPAPGVPQLPNCNSTISLALCEINHMIFSAPGALLAPSGGRCCPGPRLAGASIDRCEIWRQPGDFDHSTGWTQNQRRGFPCRIASHSAASA